MTSIIDYDKLETGDIILFHGEGFWFSRVIEWFTWSDFSHIGMVLRDPVYLDLKLTGLYMLESGLEKFPEAVEHRIQFGVQVVNLRKVLDTYVGRVYIRKLNITKTFRNNMIDVMPALWKRIKDLPYDDNLWDLMRADFRIDWGNVNKTNTFFCSALMAFLYERFGFFRKPLDWDLIQPKDFDDQGRIKDYLLEQVKLETKYLVVSDKGQAWYRRWNPFF